MSVYQRSHGFFNIPLKICQICIYNQWVVGTISEDDCEKIPTFLVIGSCLFSAATLFAHAVPARKYLAVPAFQQCLKSQFQGSYAAWCMPNAQRAIVQRRVGGSCRHLRVTMNCRSVVNQLRANEGLKYKSPPCASNNNRCARDHPR